jgi:hypothetical protein
MSVVWETQPLRFGPWRQGLLVSLRSHPGSPIDANPVNPHWQGLPLSGLCNGAVASEACHNRRHCFPPSATGLLEFSSFGK